MRGEDGRPDWVIESWRMRENPKAGGGMEDEDDATGGSRSDWVI